MFACPRHASPRDGHFCSPLQLSPCDKLTPRLSLTPTHPPIVPLILGERSEGQRCHDDNSDRTSSSSCSSETSRTGGELIDQADNAEGDTGSTLDTASVGRVCVIDKGGNKKAAIDSFVGVPPAELGPSSGGGDAGAGPTTTTRTSTIVREKGATDGSWGHAYPRLLSNDKYCATDQYGCGRIIETTQVISIGHVERISMYVHSS